MNRQPENQRGVAEDAATPSTDRNVAPAETVALTRVPSESQPPISAVAGPAESQVAATLDMPAGQSSGAESGQPAKAKPRGSAVLHTSVGDYEIQSELGRGGMGVVYKARHKQLARDVALKMILVGAHAGEEQVARFMTEAQAVAHLQHQNIVQIFDIGDHDGLPYFSLEYVDGPSLSQKVRGQPQPAKDAARMIETLARAMQYAHDHGVLHRDLKPANILLTEDGVPKISDFGLAKRLEDDGDSGNTRTGTIMGTPSYMSPEQAGGENDQLGPATDQYSLGAMLYELVTGRPPFLAAKAMETVMQVLRNEPVPPRQLQANLHVDLETICLKALQKDIGKRYADCGELAEDLRRFQAGEPILARPVSAPERLWRWCRRNPRIAASIAAVAISLVTATVVSISAAVTVAHERDQKEEQRKAAETAKELADDARIEAVKQEALAKEAEKRATKNAEIAAGQRKLALDTLYGLVTKVDEQLRDRSDMHKLRQELIEDAMAGLTKVEDSDVTRSLVDRSLGVGHQRMADIFQQMGRTEDALNQHKSAIEIFERLLAVDPQEHWARFDAALSYDKIGDLDRVLGGDPALVRESFVKALKLREELPPDLKLGELTPAKVKQGLLNSYAKLGGISMAIGDLEVARDYFRKILVTSERMVAENPKNPQAKQALSGSYLILGRLSFRLRDVEVATDYYQQALKQREELLAIDPLSVTFNRLLAGAHDALGDLKLQLLRDPDAALEHYGQSQAIFAQLCSTNSKDADLQAGLAGSLYRVATAHVLCDKRDEAAEEYGRCLALREELVKSDPKNTSKVVSLIHVQARLGKHAEAFAAAEGLVERVAGDSSGLYNLVCGYALCANAVRNGMSVDQLSDEDRSLHDRYTHRAVETLASAIEKHYKDIVQLETDPDLEALRGIDEFESLLRQLKAER